MELLRRLFGSRADRPASAATEAVSTAAIDSGAGIDSGAADSGAASDRAWQALERQQHEPAPILPIEEGEAQGELAEVYAAVKRDMQVPDVPAVMKTIAHSPQVLKATLDALGTLSGGANLPKPVVSMLSYSISMALECQYCSSFNRLTCRSVGIDEATLTALGNDLDMVAPERVRAIIKFGTKAAMSPKELSGADFEALREIGITEAEIVEIVGLAALARFTNVLSDALKIDVDPMVKQALAA